MQENKEQLRGVTGKAVEVIKSELESETLKVAGDLLKIGLTKAVAAYMRDIDKQNTMQEAGMFCGFAD